MKINGIKEIDFFEETAEVLLDVEFDKEIIQRWELEEPAILAVYTKENDVRLDYVELIELGMIVHGFEMGEDEMQQISEFLEGNQVKEKIQEKFQNSI